MLDWPRVYDMTHLLKLVLRTGAGLGLMDELMRGWYLPKASFKQPS